MPHQVFLNHSPADQLVAEKICAYLEENGVGCWLASRDLPPGGNLEHESLQALYESRLMIYLFSAYSNVSPSLPALLLEKAVEKGIPVIVFRLEEGEPSLEVLGRIDRKQWLAGQRPPSQAQLQDLLESSRALLEVELLPGKEKILESLRALAPFFSRAFLILFIIGGVWVIYWGFVHFSPFAQKSVAPGEGLCAVKPEMIRVKASAGEPSGPKPVFRPGDIMDDRPETGWRARQGEWLQMNFTKALTLGKLVLVNGCAGPEGLRQNGRVENITLRFSSGEEQSFNLEDSPERQFLRFTPVTTTSLRLIINSVYPGASSDEICLAEIRPYAFCHQLP